ncbi:cytochrome P450 [Glycomyces xiaoerkulensis]|uniref:cytochrome P450 n=1 Tax=Glycomyces xiaoerkulensis TaxID=2038139 RepID=UPI000C264724|nr:cytochrome P450 [Glycomyces xiaoerkulensis]
MTTAIPSDLDEPIELRDDGVYAVSSYELTAALLRDQRLRPATTGVIDRLNPEWRRRRSLRMLADMILLDVPPRHGAVRAAIHERFSVSAVTGMRDRIDTLAEGLIDAADEGGRPIDFAARIARALPLAVIGEIIGIDQADRPRIARRTKTIMDTMWYAVDEFIRADAAAIQLDRYFHDKIRRSRAGESETDLITALADTVGLSDDEIVANLVFLVMAATFTTGDFLGSALVRSCREPELRRRLRDRSEVEDAIEEALRLDPPVARVVRNTAVDVDAAGTTIPAGSLIEFDLRAANRDPRQFDEPDRYRADRRAGRALSFGYGAHYCAGWALGKAEAVSVLPAFWRRFPDSRLAAEPEPEPHPFLNGFGRILVDTGRGETPNRPPNPPSS